MRKTFQVVIRRSSVLSSLDFDATFSNCYSTKFGFQFFKFQSNIFKLLIDEVQF